MQNQLQRDPLMVFYRITHTSLNKGIDVLAAYLLHCHYEAEAERINPTLEEFYEVNIKHLFKYLNLPVPSLEEVDKRAQILKGKNLLK